MEKIIVEQEDFTAFFINKVKDYSLKNGTSPLNAFTSLVDSYYRFSKNHIKGTNALSHQQYYDGFCSFILSELSYFEFIPDEYFDLFVTYYNGQINICVLDNAFLSELRCAIKDERQRIQNLKAKTKEIISILDKQYILDNFSLDVIEAVMLKGLSETFLLSYIFNYGYIEGKRAERARKKRTVINKITSAAL